MRGEDPISTVASTPAILAPEGVSIEPTNTAELLSSPSPSSFLMQALECPAVMSAKLDSPVFPQARKMVSNGAELRAKMSDPVVIYIWKALKKSSPLRFLHPQSASKSVPVIEIPKPVPVREITESIPVCEIPEPTPVC
ncbi:unnamed protein product [Leuciscus chuanchicus]